MVVETTTLRSCPGRLARNARLLELPIPPLAELVDAVGTAAASRGSSPSDECLVRLMALRGAGGGVSDDDDDTAPSVWVFDQPLAAAPPTHFHLATVPAPWHSAGECWPLVDDGRGAVKWLSYGPNVMSSRLARRTGAHDALLLSRDGLVLEGPRFCVGWFGRDGAFRTPCLSLDILHSVTRSAVLEAAGREGVPVIEGRWHADELKANAVEVVAFSTGKNVVPVARIDDVVFADDGARARALSEAFLGIVRRECGLG